MSGRWARFAVAFVLVTWPALDGLATPCESVRAHLLSLSDDPKRPLQAANPLANEIVILDPGDASTQEILDRLAFVLRATWKDKELRRDSEAVQALQSLDRDARIRTITAFLKEVTVLPDTNNVNAYASAFRASLDSAEELIRNGYTSVTQPNSALRVPAWDHVQTPARVTLARVLTALGSETLADLPRYETVVFSDRPTAVQRAMPDAAQLKSWIAQLAPLGAEAVRDRPPGEAITDGIVLSTERLVQSVNQGGIARIHLFLTRRADEITCLLMLYGSRGEELGIAGRAVLRIPIQPRGMRVAPDIPDVDGTLPLSGANQEFHLISGLGLPTTPIGIEQLRPSFEFQERMFRPTKNDPLGFGVNDVLLAIGRRAGLRVMACVQDSALDAFRDCVKRQVVDFLDFLAALSDEHEIIVQDNWLLVRPKNSLESERSRIPRAALEKLMMQANDQKHLSLRAWALHHYESKVAAHRNPIARTYRSFINHLWQRSYPVVDSFEGDDYPLPVLMFLGSLSEAEYEALMHGRASFDLGGLRIDQRTWMREILGYRHLLLRRDPSSDGPDWLLTGSEAVPEVSLRGAVLRSDLTSAKAIVNQTMSFDAMKGLLNSPNTIEEVWRSFGSWPELDVTLAMNGRYVVGHQQFVRITITARTGIVRHLGIRGEFLPTTEALVFRDLPEDVRRAFGGSDRSN